MTNEEITRAFFARWSTSFEEIRASFADTFAPDCRWDQRPMAVTIGARDAIKFMDRSRKLMGITTIDVEIMRIASAGDTVLCERIDHIRGKDGRLLALASVAGVLDFRDGKIVRWREYFDVLDFMKQTCINGVGTLLDRLRSFTR